mgnify:CR=1 FL=1
MAKLEAYDKALDYSYAPGIFPATECLKNAKKRCMRLLVSSNGLQSEGVQALEKAAQEADIRVEVADRALERISKKENCFAAMVYKKAEGRFDEDSPHIVLHHPSDSGNLGTILRTADAAGYKLAILMKGTADVYAPKVVRAATGSLFRMPVVSMASAKELAEFTGAAGKKLTATCLDARRWYYDEDLTHDIALIIGNEGNGISRDLIESSDIQIKIPMQGNIESLNAAVAAGVLMYEAMRGKR